MWQSLSRWKENHRCLVDVSSLRVVWLCTVGTWHGFVFFLCFCPPQKSWEMDVNSMIFFQVWANFIFMSKKTTRKIVMNHGLKNMSVDFPANISIAETEELTLDRISAFSRRLPSLLGSVFVFSLRIHDGGFLILLSWLLTQPLGRWIKWDESRSHGFWESTYPHWGRLYRSS